ncbi:Putative uncharacterized protein [Moritella viscosa]|uniref:Uncharacterized protein n=1 Tax=Moritella viscosa TaxID=80854 RepID=A0A1L0AL86_9GAMM|nr:Putative uncharacterized protein [Moritella viscosa]SGY88047.1 Putative uncharacterized protein [Moritella viscosa]SGY88185.1 Putative uncharacterized protein [Moritella viscosa]SGY90013.1 Putative uncharacterized protein [Moritella viscosa]SGY90557.1 Putative uncharacterized protein [Moritella viscosa]
MIYQYREQGDINTTVCRVNMGESVAAGCGFIRDVNKDVSNII